MPSGSGRIHKQCVFARGQTEERQLAPRAGAQQHLCQQQAPHRHALSAEVNYVSYGAACSLPPLFKLLALLSPHAPMSPGLFSPLIKTVCLTHAALLVVILPRSRYVPALPEANLDRLILCNTQDQSGDASLEVRGHSTVLGG
jgi:hypothetical protein